MVAEAPLLVLTVLLVFCRIGTCLMVLPGFGSARVPARVRLFLALAATLALTPGLSPTLRPVILAAGEAGMLDLILVEIGIGLLIGTAGRLLLGALQMMMTVANSMIGIATMPGMPVEDEEAVPPFVSLAALFATLLLFVLDLHLEILKGLWASYAAVPVGGGFAGDRALDWLGLRLGEASLAALQVTSPFLVYGILVNLGTGLINKIMPALPVFFIVQPLVMIGGILMMASTLAVAILLYMDVFGVWLQFG